MVDDLSLKGIDQVDIARSAGVTKGAVNQWLSGGIKSMKLEYALRLERAYGYNHKWLVMGEMPVKISGPELRENEPKYSVSGGSWPFHSFTQDQFDRLPERLKGMAEHAVLILIREWEQSQPKQVSKSGKVLEGGHDTGKKSA